MLTIKKRYPWRKTFVYAGGAFIVGFAGALSFLMQSNVNQERFASAPSQTKVSTQVQKEADTPTDTSKGAQTASNDTTTWTTPPSQSSTTSNSTSATTPSTQTTTQQTAPEQTAPADTTSPSTPVDSTPPATQPTPEPDPKDPTIIDQIIDTITP